MIEVIGWIGSLCLAVCALPQVVHTIRHKKTEGLSGAFLALWGVGEIGALIYQQLKNGYTPLHWNYLANIAFISILIYYKTRSEK